MRPQVIRHAVVLKRRWIILENVVHMRPWRRYPTLKKNLEEHGDALAEYVLDASHFGVPQKRRMLFLVADLEDDLPEIEQPDADPIAAWIILDGDGVWPTTLLKAPKRAQDTLERAELAMAEVGSRRPFLLVYYGDHWPAAPGCPLHTVTTLDRLVLAKPSAKRHTMRMLQRSELRRAGFLGQVHVSARHTTGQDPAPRQRGLPAGDEAPRPRSHHLRLTET